MSNIEVVTSSPSVPAASKRLDRCSHTVPVQAPAGIRGLASRSDNSRWVPVEHAIDSIGYTSEFVQPYKTCRGCGITKSVTQFYTHTDESALGTLRYPYARCKPCHNARSAMLQRERRARAKKLCVSNGGTRMDTSRRTKGSSEARGRGAEASTAHYSSALEVAELVRIRTAVKAIHIMTGDALGLVDLTAVRAILGDIERKCGEVL